MKKIRLALLTTDKREHEHTYEKAIPGFGTAPEALLSGFLNIPEINVEIISCAQRRMASPLILGENIRHHTLLVPKWGWLRTAYLGCIVAVRRKLAELQPDIIHAQGTERDCAISSVFSPYPKVLTIHGNCRAIAEVRGSGPISFWGLQARLEKFCLPRFGGVICISKYTQGLVAGLAKKTWLLPNAVDPAFFDIVPCRQGTIPRFLVVASVEHRKNQIGLIRSLDSIARSGKFHVRFFGKCGEDAYGKEFLALIGERPWISFGGEIDRKTLRGELAEATGLILPTWEDNCPMVILEAQAAGVPVIASEVGGVPDLVQNGITGLLTVPSQPATMPKAVSLILENPRLADNLAQAGRAQAFSRFHPRVIAQRHLEIYRELIVCR